MSLVSRFTATERATCAAMSTHLFVDEAHHIRAATWEQFRDDFRSRRTVQFTATPFRNDGQHVDGRVVFNYPLRRAQAEKYFTPIRLLPVFEFDPDEVDKAIALAAIKQLTDDVAAGHDHILLARVASIPAAEQLIELYNLHGASFNPRLVHSKLSSALKREYIADLRNRKSRIAICVDMFGEGFDLPELKIAALHDTHKSLAVTLQFIGRFARAKNTIGEATVVVNLADSAVDDSLRELYAEGSDWNQILRNLSEGATGQHSAVQQFVDDFAVQNLMIPIQNLTPAMSAVVYKTTCLDWKPYKLGECFPEDSVISGPAVNASQRVAYIVTKDVFPIDWGEIREFVNTSYELSLMYWDKNRQLLFIHTSNKESSHETIAKAVAGDNAELIKGTTVFRVFSGLNRLLLQTLGLTHAVGRLIRFTMLVGADIHSGLAEGQTQTKVKTNIFASGFENGSFVTIGCSRKGRLWSRLSATNLLAWVDWCSDIGTKLLDPTFSEDNILKNSIVPEEISERPKLVPLVIEWPTSFYELDDAYISVEFGGTKLPMYRVGMRLLTHDDTSPIRFNIFSDENSAEFELRYSKTGADYAQISGPEVAITVGRRKKSMSDWFKSVPPIVRFEQDAFTEDNQLCRPNQVRSEVFDKQKIEAWTWQGVDLSRESQTDHKYVDSIQYRVIAHLKSSSSPIQYEILFDDDSAGEAADVIGLAVSNDELIIHFFHCKYSSASDPGARTADLFVLCGQAQLSVQWRSNIANLLSHLMHRDISRVKQGRPTRFERGDRKQLLKIQRQAPTLTPRCSVFMVQPGLSKTSVSVRQLELLGATELYLMETSQMPLRVIASE